MVSWASLERKGSSSKELDVDELYDQLSTMGAYIKQLTGAFGKVANRRWGHARALVAGTAHDAEETINDNLAASLIIAVGLGVLIGYMIRRGSE
jgi:hypothetical protein